jgi:hypothetical protein
MPGPDYDKQLDEKDWPEWCPIHEFYQPCRDCYSDEADRQHDERRERS